MSPPQPFDSQSRRLAVYGYLASLLGGRKVLELGCGEGAGAARLLALGATSVLALEADAATLTRARQANRTPGLQFAALDRRSLDGTGPFGLILVPDGAPWLSPGAPFSLAALRTLLAADGRLAVVAASADRPAPEKGSVGYYALLESLESLFPTVRMFGLSPFAAFGAAEFGSQSSGLRIEAGLVDEGAEQPSHYLALAGPDPGPQLTYTLVQIPAALPAPSITVAETTVIDNEARAAAVGLRHRLVEAEGKAEGMLRVSRAQAEEIEELRARLRRGAESRGELDQEIARLRRALAEADASVLDLTRRTREEVSELARQITAGLRSSGRAEPEAAARDDGAAVARLREELRRRREELAARESAVSERDQRIAALEAEKQELLRRQPARSYNGSARPDDGATGPAQAAIDQYRLAATAHLEEVNRLREALAEQSTLVNELEDALAATSRRAQTAEGELERLRKHTSEVEQADRTRRSRLAEVEGTLLRLQRQAAAPAAAPAAVVPSAELDQALREATHLREALDRTEEQLWETKGRMLLDGERLAALERQLEEAVGGREPTISEAAHHGILSAVLGELAEIELGVRLEIGKLESLEHVVESWRSEPEVAEVRPDGPVSRAD